MSSSATEPKPSCGLLELPLELRTMVAKYVLTYEHGLEVATSCASDTVFTICKAQAPYSTPDTNLSSLINPFALVCHQLHSETTEILFNVNTLTWPRQLCRAFTPFIEHAQPQVLKAVRKMNIGINQVPKVCELEGMLEKLPRAILTITISDWTFKRGRLHSNAARGYYHGKNLEAQVKAMDKDAMNGKRWRVYPAKLRKLEDLEVFRERGGSHRVERVLAWFDNGI